MIKDHTHSDSEIPNSDSSFTKNESDNNEFLKIISLNDQNLKELGESLSNQNSRQIIESLLSNELTANEIAHKTGLSLSHTIYHLEKLQKVGIVTITRIEKNEKGHDMKYYSSKFSLLVVPDKIYEKTFKSKSLRNIFNRFYKFVAIGGAALISWIMTAPSKITTSLVKNDGEQTPVADTGDFQTAVLITLTVVLVGLIIERITLSLKK